jgi:hypothetical protein
MTAAGSFFLSVNGPPMIAVGDRPAKARSGLKRPTQAHGRQPLY